MDFITPSASQRKYPGISISRVYYPFLTPLIELLLTLVDFSARMQLN